MNFFHTLKDKNVKALFKTLAPELYPTNGESWETYVHRLTDEQKFRVFHVVHRCLEALDAPNWQEPKFLNAKPLPNPCSEILMTKVRFDD